ncbi:cell division protein FtsL [Peribacillus frigoritolerans]|uniref:cell division protein FtsL n=1 Tax=Peribacillus frigoritolerans TaxID=450367 RepID=UPI00105940D7|nr:cell division protein FtsL [Peribacillus frigoritolerans]TDL79970.1 cell division protein FtsL [Peribacillus frigoritolerans]
MSNLAVKLQQQRQEQHKHMPEQQQTVVITRRPTITVGEKVLIVAFLSVLLFAAIQIVSNSVTVYQSNIEIQQIESQVQDQQKVNSDLTVQVKELSTYERIMTEAKKQGLNLNPDNVKAVNE